MAAPAHVTDSTIRNARFLSYPKPVAYFVASFIALVALCHFASLAYRYAIRKKVASYSNSGRRTSASLSRLLPAIIDSSKAIMMRWTIPVGASHTLNLAEVVVVSGYVAILLAWTLAGTTTLEGQKFDPHYYADRAGNMASSQLPLLIALGMKNNLISALTGIGFDKLNFLHRMCARSLVILAWIHGGGRITLGLVPADGDDIHMHWIQLGILAGTTLTLLCILTVRPIRERDYELFLIIHFVFSFILIIVLYFHTAGMMQTYYGVWPAMVVWGLDRFLTLSKILIFNFAYFNPWSKSRGDLDASVQVLSHHFVKVTLHRPSYFYWRPGQSAYLSFPGVSFFPFESHPFTMSTIYDSDAKDGKGNQLVFFMRVRRGFTARLVRAQSQARDGDRKYKVFVNGPYSSPPVLLGYQSVMLFSGGSGVTFTLPLFLSLISRAKRNEPSCSRLTFVWMIKDADQINWIEDVLSSAIDGLPNSISVSIKLFITSILDDSETIESDGSSDNIEAEKMGKSPDASSSPRLLESPLVALSQGRPDLNALIQDEIKADVGPISINVCGTGSLAETVRRAVRVPRFVDVLRGGPTISLHIEPFGV